MLSASLFLSFDGVCLAPRKTERLCPPRSYTIDIHPIFNQDWFHEREVDIGPLVSQGSVWPAGAPQRLSWDVTDQVIEWVEYGTPNNGLLLKLADGQEDFFVSGPRVPSSEFADPAHRPAAASPAGHRGAAQRRLQPRLQHRLHLGRDAAAAAGS